MRRALRVFCQTTILTVLSLGLWALAQTGDYFENYPGGFTQAVYEIVTDQLENPITLGFEIEPVSGDQFTVTSTSRVTARREDLGIDATNGVAQAQLLIQDEAVRVLLENRNSLRPQTTFVLPSGARFTSAERETIAGVSVLCGMLTKPDRRTQRIFLAITQDPTLPFPPWILQQEERGSGGTSGSFDVCTSLLPLAQQSDRQYVILFELELTQFEHRE